MKKIVIRTGFHPEHPRIYNGEHIYKVIQTRGNVEYSDFLTGQTKSQDKEGNVGALSKNLENTYTLYQLESNVWIKDLGRDRYVTDWTSEERWGRVEELEIDDEGEVTDSRNLGFMILRVDRSRGLL